MHRDLTTSRGQLPKMCVGGLQSFGWTGMVLLPSIRSDRVEHEHSTLSLHKFAVFRTVCQERTCMNVTFTVTREV